MNETCKACGEPFADGDEKCPQCGCHVVHAFGLAGGGYGPYQFCGSDECDYFAKQPMAADEA